MKNIFTSTPFFQQQGLAIIRVITGLFMVYHGWEVLSASKMEEYAQWDMFKNDFGKTLVYLGKGAELLAGLCLALGLFTRLSALILAVTMLYIAFFVGKGRIWYEDQHPFMFVLMATVYILTGSGPYSLDHLLSKNRSKNS